MRIAFLTRASIVCSLIAVSASFAEISTTRNFYQFSDRVLTTGQPDQALLKKASKPSRA